MKQLTITEEDQTIKLTVIKDRVKIQWIYYEEQSDGTMFEGGSSTFSMPLDKLQEFLSL